MPGLVFPEESVRRVDRARYLVQTASGQVVLDVTSGAAHPVTETPPSWCADRASYQPALQVADRASNDLGVTEWWPCDPDGEPLELPVTIPDPAGDGGFDLIPEIVGAGPAALGAWSGDVFAWIAPGELRAVTVQPG